jgi:CheY-like chemotaxis protein
MSGSPPRVLVVEDEQHLADGLRFNLEAEGYDADVVDSGEAAIERLVGPERRPYDLVVLDVMLPGKDGFAVVSELRAAKQFVPVLILTALGRPEEVLKGRASERELTTTCRSRRSWPSCSPGLAASCAAAAGCAGRRIRSRSTARRSISTGSSCVWTIASCRSR